MPNAFDIPVAHIDNPESISPLIDALTQFHEGTFGFAVRSWHGAKTLDVLPGKTAYRFTMRAQQASIELSPGDSVRGPSASGPYAPVDALRAKLTANHSETLLPGDAIVTNEEMGSADISGSGVYFEVTADTTSYPAPKLGLLRNLADKPGGCAAYDDAFRRELLPPINPPEDEMDRIGVNRVNEHTLDMRIDRTPPPTRHHHGQVHGPNGRLVNHTETALVLPRSACGLPEVSNTESGQAIIYRDPVGKGLSDPFTIPVTPGSIVVTPSTADSVFGHCFENAFAMLVAVPGFVAPYVMIEDR